MKKIISLALAALMCLSLFACGKSNPFLGKWSAGIDPEEFGATIELGDDFSDLDIVTVDVKEDDTLTINVDLTTITAYIDENASKLLISSFKKADESYESMSDEEILAVCEQFGLTPDSIASMINESLIEAPEDILGDSFGDIEIEFNDGIGSKTLGYTLNDAGELVLENDLGKMKLDGENLVIEGNDEFVFVKTQAN